jgi:uncharacterized protein YkwD
VDRRGLLRCAAALAMPTGVAGCAELLGTRAPGAAESGSRSAVTGPTSRSPEPAQSSAPSAGDSRIAQVVELTNAARRRQGLSSLVADPRLAAAAQAHSEDMVRRHYFAHVDPDGKSPADRVESRGYQWSVVAENIAAGPRTPEEVVTAWMNSPEHRANILDARITQIGVGYATANDEYGTYWTQDFGRPLG